MCGIFGYVGHKPATPIILQGLQRLEYRGYDSAGVAILNSNGKVLLKKKKGKVKELAASIEGNQPQGKTGLGHTRWATHGIPNNANSHPHLDCEGKLAIIHNGIIENFGELRESLMKEGHRFASDTDSEVLAHLVEKHYKVKGDLKYALMKAAQQAKGAYAIGVIHQNNPGTIVATRVDSPLVIGLGKNENFIASDLSAILEHTHETISLEDGDIIEMNAKNVRIMNSNLKQITRKTKHIDWDIKHAQKQGYEHFMLKEIFEQPDVLKKMIAKRIHQGKIHFEEFKLKKSQLKKIKHITIVACGTSYHAGMVGRYVLEDLTPYTVSVDISSEFRYRNPKLNKETLVCVISQSGETADTLAALREAKKRGCLTMALCNVLGSSIERETDGVINTDAGPEIGVASTKAYTAQLGTLYLMALGWGKSKPSLLADFKRLPKQMNEVLEDYKTDENQWTKNVHKYNVRYHDFLSEYYKADPHKRKRAPNAFFLYLGRNINYPNALEGALKLKEIAYISAEGYAAGEMKHGPIALIDENPWVIAIATASNTYDKMISNIQEIKARGGMITAIISKGDKRIKDLDLYLYVEVPKTKEIFSPFVVALPLQLIAYVVAKEFKEDIDQPRNLAKSVTVE